MKFFVYGSLKQGEFNHDRYGFDHTAIFCGPARMKGIEILVMHDAPYPHAYLASGSDAEGELYEIDLNTWEGVRLFVNLFKMEASAGYNMHWLDAIDEHERTVPAVVFVADEWRLGALRRTKHTVVKSWKGEPVLAG